MKALALTLLFSCCIVAANAADTLKAQIEASNKPIHQAMLKKDFPTLEKLFKATWPPLLQSPSSCRNKDRGHLL